MEFVYKLHESCLLLQRDLPYQLDNDLKTRGTTTLGNAIDTEKQFFGAHYRSVTEPDGSHRLVGFNFTEEAQNGVVNFWEFDDKFKRLSKEQVKLPVSGCCILNTQRSTLKTRRSLLIAQCSMLNTQYSVLSATAVL